MGIRGMREKDRVSKAMPIPLRLLWIGIGLLFLLVIHWLPTPQPIDAMGQAIVLSHEAKDVLAVIMMMIVLWASQVIPFHITGLLGLIILPMLGLPERSLTEGFRDLVSQGFGNQIVIFLGSLGVIAASIARVGLDRRAAHFLLRRFSGSPRLLLFGLLGIGASISIVLTNMAAAAILLPVAQRILKMVGDRDRKGNLGRALLMSVAWGPLIGGVGSPAGSGANPVFIGFMTDLASTTVSFGEWMKLGLPLVVILTGLAWGVLTLVFPVDRQVLSGIDIASMKPQSQVPIWHDHLALRALLLPVLALTLWIGFPQFGLTWSALLVAVVAFMPGIGVLRWEDASDFVPWDALILVAAGMAVGIAAYNTGAASYVGYRIFGSWVTAVPSFARDTLVSWGTAVLHVPFSSNSLMASISAPLLIPIGQAMGFSLWSFLAPSAMTSSLAFLFVTEGPTSILAFSAGRFSFLDYLRAGALMTLLTGPIVAVCTMLLASPG